MLENKLSITDSAELARAEEKISKRKAIEMFETGFLEKLEPEHIKVLQTFINIFLMRFMILQANCVKSIFQKEISDLPRLCTWKRPCKVSTKCPSQLLMKSWKNM